MFCRLIKPKKLVQEFLLTDFIVDLKHDEDVQELQEGAILWAVQSGRHEHVEPTKVNEWHTRGFAALSTKGKIMQTCKRSRHATDQDAYSQERVNFQPHPNTLTMSGELEYWAAQVGSPHSWTETDAQE